MSSDLIRLRQSEYLARKDEAEARMRDAADRLAQARDQHEDRMRFAESKHYDDMRAKARSDAIAMAKVNATSEYQQAHLKQVERFHVDEMESLRQSAELKGREIRAKYDISRNEIEFKREMESLNRESALAIAFIDSKTKYEIASMQHEAAMELSCQNHEQALALSEMEFCQTLSLTAINHINALSTKYFDLYASKVADVSGLYKEKLIAMLRVHQDTMHQYTSAMAAIITEKKRHELELKMAEQKEQHRENERRHEVKMAILQSGLRVDEMTKTEFVRHIIRLMEGAHSNSTQNELQKWAEECFDEWSRGKNI